MRRKKKITEEQLNTLYECWKEAENYKERLELVKSRLPNFPPAVALQTMRKHANSDTKWAKMATRKKNSKEKEKLEKQQQREQKKLEKDRRRQERLIKKQQREEKHAQKQLKNTLYENLGNNHIEELQKRIIPEFFFCNEVQQFVNNIACIFRIFNKDHASIVNGSCDKCKRMNNNIPIIQEVINGQTIKKKRTRRNKTA